MVRGGGFRGGVPGEWAHRFVISSRDGIDTGSLEESHGRPAALMKCRACGPSPGHNTDSELRDRMMGHPEAAAEETQAVHAGKIRSGTGWEQSAGGEK